MSSVGVGLAPEANPKVRVRATCAPITGGRRRGSDVRHRWGDAAGQMATENERPGWEREFQRGRNLVPTIGQARCHQTPAPQGLGSEPARSCVRRRSETAIPVAICPSKRILFESASNRCRGGPCAPSDSRGAILRVRPLGCAPYSRIVANGLLPVSSAASAHRASRDAAF